jgi:manganese/zinc/iron transport system permease protein
VRTSRPTATTWAALIGTLLIMVAALAIWRPAYNTLVVLSGASLLGACSGLVGSFAVLRGRALMGDALAHAALPGLGLAFLLLGRLSLPAMLAGALATGLLGVATVAVLRRWTRTKEDAAIGIVLSVFFGAGIVLSQQIQQHTASGAQAGLDSYIYGKTAGMLRGDVLLIAAVAAGCVAVVAALYKEFKLVSFDSGFAKTQGWPVVWLDLAIMALVAVTVIIGLPAVGVVLMAALLILPAAAARFWTDRLGSLLALASLFGLSIGAAGTTISALVEELPAGPVIVLVGAGVFLVSLLAAPRRGAIAHWIQQRRFRQRLARQRLLAAAYDLLESHGPGELPLEDLAWRAGLGQTQAQRLAAELERLGLVTFPKPGRYELTSSGRREAARAARTARLWQEYLLVEPDEARGSISLDYETIEADLPADVLARLEALLAASGRLPAEGGSPSAGAD